MSAEPPPYVPYPAYWTWQPQPPPRVEPPRRPAVMRLILRLMGGGAALSVAGTVEELLRLRTSSPSLRHGYHDAGEPLTTGQLRVVLAVIVVVLIVAEMLTLATWLWMASKNGAGRPWARVVATVIGGVTIALGVVSLALGAHPVGPTVLSALGLVLAIVLIVLLWLPASSAFYAQSEAARRWSRYARQYVDPYSRP